MSWWFFVWVCWGFFFPPKQFKKCHFRFLIVEIFFEPTEGTGKFSKKRSSDPLVIVLLALE